MLAREYASETKRKSPIICSHAMLPGLLKNQEKMSKSNPSSAIFMDDSEEEVNRKIQSAWCPPGEVEGNPCMSYFQHIVFPSFQLEDRFRSVECLNCVQKRDYFYDYQELKEAYIEKVIHPLDLKNSLARYLNSLLEPIRQHFVKNPEAARIREKVLAMN